jgi:glucosylceramidase
MKPAAPPIMDLLLVRKLMAAGLALFAGALLALPTGALAAGAGHLPPSSSHHRHHKSIVAPSVSVFETTFGLVDALTPMPSRAFAKAPAPGVPVLRVNPAVTYQRITGFGGAMTDSSAWLLYDELTPAARAATMRALFASDGIHLDFVRIPMAASDFTTGGVPYSYDDVPRGQTNSSLSHFSIAHDEAYILPALRLMLRIDKHVQTLASLWSPPAWMKTNDAFDNADGQGDVYPSDYWSLAQYFVRFILAYQDAGVPIDAITPMNEPHSDSPWPSTSFPPSAEIPFVSRFLTPELSDDGLHPQIFGLDDTELSDARALLNSAAAPDLGGMAFHCYQGLGSLTVLHDEYPDENLIESECSPGIIRYSPAEVGIDATRNWASAVQLWNLALDPAGGPVQPPNAGCPGCTGIVTVSPTSHATTYGRNYYEFGQISKFVQPGAVRIASTRLVSDWATGPNHYGVTAGIDDVAFLNPDSSKVLVAYNNSTTRRSFAFEYHGAYVPYTLAPRATVTFTWH